MQDLIEPIEPLEQTAPVHSDSDLLFKSKSLIEACKNGDLALAKDLCHQGANVNWVDEDGNFALYVAVNYQHKEIVELLIENQANVNQVKENASSIIESVDRNAYAWQHTFWRSLLGLKNLVELSWLRNNYEIADILIKSNAKVDRFLLNKAEAYKRVLKIPELYQAMQDNDYDTVKKLIIYGVNPNVNFIQGTFIKSKVDALSLAIANNDHEFIEILFKKGYKFKPLKHQDLWFKAIENGDLELIKIFLDRDSKLKILTQVDHQERNCIVACVASKKINQSQKILLLNHFLEKKAKVDHCDKFKLSALHYASINAEAEIVETLLNFNAIANIKDQNLNLPIYYAQLRLSYDDENIRRQASQKIINLLEAKTLELNQPSVFTTSRLEFSQSARSQIARQSR